MGAFKLGKMTFGSLFKKPETVLYPIEKKPQPAGLKGKIAIQAGDCILCGMCDRSCATNCISVDKQARTWSIDRLQCVQCGYCITVCPKKCLAMDPDYAPATTAHEADVVAVPEQAKPAAKRKDDGGAASTSRRANGPSGEKPDSPHVAAGKAAPAADGCEAEQSTKADEQLIALIGLMEPGRAEKVKAALNR